MMERFQALQLPLSRTTQHNPSFTVARWLASLASQMALVASFLTLLPAGRFGVLVACSRHSHATCQRCAAAKSALRPATTVPLPAP